MSINEFKSYLRGYVLNSNIDHSAGYITSSVGFCFLAEKTEFESVKGHKIFTPEKCLEFLTGLVSENILACFDIPDKYIKKAAGLHADPFGEDNDVIRITEYNVEKYSKSECKLIKFAIPLFAGNLEFDWFAFPTEKT